MKKNTIIFTISFVAIAIIISLIALLVNSRRDVVSQKDLYEAITDSLYSYKTKDSLNAVRIQIIQTDREKDFLTIKNLTGTNLELQNLVKNKDKRISELSAALILKDETVIYDTTRVFHPIGGDTLVFSQSILLDTINTQWYDATFGFRYGFSHLDLKIRNQYNVTLGYEGGNWFKRGTPYARVVNLNPYTQTNDLRVYQVAVPPPKRFGLGIQSGFGGLYDIRNNNLGYGFYIGLGFSYNIIRW